MSPFVIENRVTCDAMYRCDAIQCDAILRWHGAAVRGVVLLRGIAVRGIRANTKQPFVQSFIRSFVCSSGHALVEETHHSFIRLFTQPCVGSGEFNRVFFGGECDNVCRFALSQYMSNAPWRACCCFCVPCRVVVYAYCGVRSVPCVMCTPWLPCFVLFMPMLSNMYY
jgi:hypothetical protein